MSLVIPDLVIVDSLNIGLNVLRQDYAARVAAGQENRSALYLLFNGLSTGKYNLFDNIKKLIITTPQDPNHIEVVSSFQSLAGKSPAVYVSMPSESDKNNSIGIGEGAAPEIVFDNGTGVQDEYKKQYMRRYNTNYYVVVVANNRNDMAILYTLFKYLIVILTAHLAFEGIENLKIGGQDLQMNDSTGIKMFQRGIVLNFEYSQLAPELAFDTIYQKVRLFWKMDGSEVAKGPIEFEA